MSKSCLPAGAGSPHFCPHFQSPAQGPVQTTFLTWFHSHHLQLSAQAPPRGSAVLKHQPGSDQHQANTRLFSHRPTALCSTLLIQQSQVNLQQEKPMTRMQNEAPLPASTCPPTKHPARPIRTHLRTLSRRLAGRSTAAQAMAGDEEAPLQPSCSLHCELPGHQARGSSLSIPDASAVQGEQVKKENNCGAH